MSLLGGSTLVRMDGSRLLWLIHGNSRAPMPEDVADELALEVVDVGGAASRLVAAMPVLADAANLDGLVREAVFEAWPEDLAGDPAGMADAVAAAFVDLLGVDRG